MSRIVYWLSMLARLVLAPVLVLWWIAGVVQYAMGVLIAQGSQVVGMIANAPWKGNVQTMSGAGSYLAAANSVFPIDDLLTYITAYTALAALVVLVRWVKSFIPALSN